MWVFIFAATKLSSTTWYLATFFIAKAKEGVAALNLRNFLCIFDRAAFRMKHKLQIVMKNDGDKRKLSGIIVLDNVCPGGRRQGCKRGRGAPGKYPLIAALGRNEKSNPIYLRLSPVKAFSCEAVKIWRGQHLEPQRIVISDGLDPERIKPFPWLNIITGNLRNTIRGTHYAVSTQHISHYLAEFSYLFNHRFNLELMVSDLNKLVAKLKPFSQH